MSYPPRCILHKNFALAEAKGETIDQVALAGDLSRVCESVNQVITFIRSTHTADKKWQPAEALEMTLNESEAYVATSGQTEFLFTGYTADLVTDTARVFVNGTKLLQADVTLSSDRVTIPAQTAGSNVEVELYDDADGVLAKLASNLAALGASLVGIEDVAGNYDAATVEDALAEVYLYVDQVNAALTPILGAVLKDGSVPFEAEQSMGGHKLTGVATGTADTDAVNVAQLNVLQALFGDLTNTFLQLVGGEMSGAINMGGNVIVGLPDAPASDDEAASKVYVDTKFASSTDGALLVDGSRAMTADLDAGDNKLVSVADGTVDTDGVSKGQMDSAIAAAVDVVQAGFELGGRELGDSVTVTAGGVYHIATGIVTGAFTLGAFLRLHSKGNLTWTATVTADADPGGNVELLSEGDISVTAPITAPNGDIIIETTGAVTIAAGGNLEAQAGHKIRIKAGGNVSIDATLTAEVIEIDCAGDYSQTTTFTARHYNAGGASDGSGTPRDSTGDARTLTRYNVEFLKWGGAPGLAGPSASDGPGGGAGGTGGGGGGSSTANSYGGDESPVKGGSRLYLFPVTLGAGGGNLEDGALSYIGGDAGGVIDIYVGGDATMTGASLDASANTGTSSGGSGGGTVRLAVKGTLTDGTGSANGSAGTMTSTNGSGGGGGGGVYFTASAVAGVQTLTAAAGVGGGPGSAGAAGTTETATLTADQIQGLYTDGWLQPGKFVVTEEP